MANKQEEVIETQETPVAETAETAEAVDAVETAPAAEEAVEVKAEAEAAAPQEETAGTETPVRKGERGNRAQKVGTVSSDKMTKTCVVRVDRLVKHPKYRRYVRRRTKFMAHNEMGATTGDRVRIVETRPLSAHKRWRVVEIIQKAAK
jgi:small subunit ribosomal protein S17